MGQMIDKYSNIKICYKPVTTIAIRQDNKDYFCVIILAPQVFEQLLNEIEMCFENNWIEYAEHKDFLEVLSKQEMEIRDMYLKSLKEEKIKTRIIFFFYRMYENGMITPKEFKKYLTKINYVFAVRNILAHEYYIKKINTLSLKSSAKSCFDIMDKLLHVYNSRAWI